MTTRMASSLSSSSSARIRLVAVSVGNLCGECTNLPKLQSFLCKHQTDRSPPSAVIVAGDFLSPYHPLSSIDQGKSVIHTMRSSGISHLCFGNHESDFGLGVLRDRISEFDQSSSSTVGSSSTTTTGGMTMMTLINTNMRATELFQQNEYVRIVSATNDWNAILERTPPYSIVSSSCQRVSVALLGLVSNETCLFRDGTFRGVPIDDPLTSFASTYKSLIMMGADENKNKNSSSSSSRSPPDYIIPITHQSLPRDMELASQMLDIDRRQNGGVGMYKKQGLIIGGGHEEDDINESVPQCHYNADGTINERDDDDDDTAGLVSVLQTGHKDMKLASLIDLEFDFVPEQQQQQQQQQGRPKLVNVTTEFVELGPSFEDSFVVKAIVDGHMSTVANLENEVLVDLNNNKNDLLLSSKDSRYRQTSAGALFCDAIQAEMGDDIDVALLHGGAIRGNADYHDGQMTYGQLKEEINNSEEAKIVVVPMTRELLYKAITYSRMNTDEGVVVNDDDDDNNEDDTPFRRNTQGPRRRAGYLQTDSQTDADGCPYPQNPDEMIQVALPRSLLKGYCKNVPLMQLGKMLKDENRFPASDVFVPAKDLVTRHWCKNRWTDIIKSSGFQQHLQLFDDVDLNNDGVLDKHEITVLMKRVLGYTPQEFVVDDMIDSIDADGNGVIDQEEFSCLLARMEREASR